MTVLALRRAGKVGRAIGPPLVAAALTFSLTGFAFGPSASPGYVLTANVNFTVTAAVSSSSTSFVPAGLYPGAHYFLWYTVNNPYTGAFTVTSLSINSSTAPAGCPISNLDLTGTTFTGALLVPALSSNTVAVPISMDSAAGNGCQGATFSFTYTGSATSTTVFATTTALVSSLNPSIVGQQVTYT